MTAPEKIFALGQEAVVFVLLKLAKMVTQKEQGKLVVNSDNEKKQL